MVQELISNVVGNLFVNKTRASVVCTNGVLINPTLRPSVTIAASLLRQVAFEWHFPVIKFGERFIAFVKQIIQTNFENGHVDMETF